MRQVQGGLTRGTGHHRWTGPSTNASCQLEKAENWYAETWGPASTPGVDSATPRIIVSNRRERAERKNPRNVTDTGNGGGRRCCQDNGVVRFVRGWCGSPLSTLLEVSPISASLTIYQNETSHVQDVRWEDTLGT